jgi:hypothetical protein
MTKDDEKLTDYKNNLLVKKGGLKKILECYFSHNKDVYKKFQKETKVEAEDSDSDESVKAPAKKRQRTNSNVSGKSV